MTTFVDPFVVTLKISLDYQFPSIVCCIHLSHVCTSFHSPHTLHIYQFFHLIPKPDCSQQSEIIKKK